MLDSAGFGARPEAVWTHKAALFVLSEIGNEIFMGSSWGIAFSLRLIILA
jgi:hypothetical protein